MSNFDQEIDLELDDTLSPLCTCGQLTPAEMLATTGGNTGKKKTSTWLESSFVHLVTPRSKNKNDVHQQPQQQRGLLEQHQHAMQLLDAAHALAP